MYRQTARTARPRSLQLQRQVPRLAHRSDRVQAQHLQVHPRWDDDRHLDQPGPRYPMHWVLQSENRDQLEVPGGVLFGMALESQCRPQLRWRVSTKITTTTQTPTSITIAAEPFSVHEAGRSSQQCVHGADLHDYDNTIPKTPLEVARSSTSAIQDRGLRVVSIALVLLATSPGKRTSEAS
jgi:hypothetical protein